MKNLNETIWLIFKHCVTSVLIFAEFKVSFLKIQNTLRRMEYLHKNATTILSLISIQCTLLMP